MTKEPLFTAAISTSSSLFASASPDRAKAPELSRATVVMNEKVVQAV
jgi:hypothetical protein